jgi:hypothetical protein
LQVPKQLANKKIESPQPDINLAVVPPLPPPQQAHACTPRPGLRLLVDAKDTARKLATGPAGPTRGSSFAAPVPPSPQPHGPIRPHARVAPRGAHSKVAAPLLADTGLPVCLETKGTIARFNEDAIPPALLALNESDWRSYLVTASVKLLTSGTYPKHGQWICGDIVRVCVLRTCRPACSIILVGDNLEPGRSLRSFLGSTSSGSSPTLTQCDTFCAPFAKMVSLRRCTKSRHLDNVGSRFQSTNCRQKRYGLASLMLVIPTADSVFMCVDHSV